MGIVAGSSYSLTPWGLTNTTRHRCTTNSVTRAISGMAYGTMLSCIPRPCQRTFSACDVASARSRTSNTTCRVSTEERD